MESIHFYVWQGNTSISLLPEQQLHVCDEISTGTCIENVNCQLFSLYSVVILLDLMDFFSILDAGVTKRLTGAKLRGVLGVFRNCQRDLLYGIWAWESWAESCPRSRTPGQHSVLTADIFTRAVVVVGYTKRCHVSYVNKIQILIIAC